MNKDKFDKIISKARENLQHKNETNFNEIHKHYGLNTITAENFVKALNDYGKPNDLNFKEAQNLYDNTIVDVVISKN